MTPVREPGGSLSTSTWFEFGSIASLGVQPWLQSDHDSDIRSAPGEIHFDQVNRGVCGADRSTPGTTGIRLHGRYAAVGATPAIMTTS